MRNRRYGKFRFGDYTASWEVIALWLLFSIAALALALPRWMAVLPAVFAAVRLWAVLSPQRESFILNRSSVTVFRGRKSRTVDLPSDITIVVSYADICPPLTVRTPVGNRTHILKDKYAVSILRETPLDAALDGLHRNGMKKYTSSWVQAVFEGCRYVYGFVCDQAMLDELIADRPCLLIIPESLSVKIAVSSAAANVYIDAGC